jgi:hypothetical protein
MFGKMYKSRVNNYFSYITYKLIKFVRTIYGYGNEAHPETQQRNH